MKTIYKYKLQPYDKVKTFEGGQCLKVMIQNGSPYIWIAVDTTRKQVTRTFVILGTGEEIKETDRLAWIDTFGEDNKNLIWHVFEIVDFD